MQSPQIVINNHYAADPRLDELHGKVDAIMVMCHAIIKTQGVNMSKITDQLDAILADTAAEKTQIASLKTFIAGLQQQLTDAIAAAGGGSDIVNKVNDIFAAVEANKADLADALNAGTPVQGADPNAPGDGTNTGAVPVGTPPSADPTSSTGATQSPTTTPGDGSATDATADAAGSNTLP